MEYRKFFSSCWELNQVSSAHYTKAMTNSKLTQKIGMRSTHTEDSLKKKVCARVTVTVKLSCFPDAGVLDL